MGSDADERSVRVAALTAGRLVPSARLRVRQHLERLGADGLEVREYVPRIARDQRPPLWPKRVRSAYSGPYLAAWLLAKLWTRVPGIAGSWRADVTWLQKELIPGLSTLEGVLRQPIVFDVDDAIWMGSRQARRCAAALARRAELVVAGNHYLAAWFDAQGARTEVVPTAIDLDRYRVQSPTSRRRARAREAFVVGWIGTEHNLSSLEALDGPLAQFFRSTPGTELLVVCDGSPDLPNVPVRQIEVVPWSESVEVAAIDRMSVGLMPLANDEWSRGKCSYKMLQYMAMAKPVVVSPVGTNGEILELGEVGHAVTEPGDWVRALQALKTFPERALALGRAGRKIVEDHFDADHISRRLAQVLRRVASGHATSSSGAA